MTEVEQLREALRQKQAVIEDLERRERRMMIRAAQNFIDGYEAGYYNGYEDRVVGKVYQVFPMEGVGR